MLMTLSFGGCCDPLSCLLAPVKLNLTFSYSCTLLPPLCVVVLSVLAQLVKASELESNCLPCLHFIGLLKKRHVFSIIKKAKRNLK